MNPNDVYAVLQWWFVLFLLGIGFAPLTWMMFTSFIDKGYLFSKLVGLMLVGYVVFVLGSFHIAPFSASVILVSAISLACGSFLLLQDKGKLLSVVHIFWKLFLIEELSFLVILFIWAYIHSFAPDIHGLEKFMDYGFLNSFLRSDYLPAKDMWFTPFTINYYYFGHLLTAMLTKLSGLPSSVTFNLMLSTIVAFCFTMTFSLGANLYAFLVKKGSVSKVKIILSGMLTACLVTLAGNLHILYAFFKPYNTDNPVPLWQLPFLSASFPNSYWYPNATRFIYHTIHEFPIYSWVVADLHGHVLDIPFVLLIISFLLSLTMKYTNEKEKAKTGINHVFKINPLELLFIGLLLACMYMTNAWDGAIYWLLTFLVLSYLHKLKLQRFWGRDLLLSLLFVTASLLIFTTPYNIHFKPFASGIGILCAPDFLTHIGKIGPFLFEAQHCQRSYWWELATLYGFFYFFAISFGIFLLRSKKHLPTDVFVLLLIMLSTVLIIIPEFFYLKDIYPAHYRANTMFKLCFQAFIMLGLSSGYVIVRIASDIPNQLRKNRIFSILFLLIATILVYLVMSYPHMAINSYYNNLKKYQGLDGTAYLKTLYPDDYAGIHWLNANVTGQPVILEAQGDSYTDYSRISANTGLPTVLGWTVHEWLWRGTYDIPAPRIEEIKTIYETPSASSAKILMNKYHVQYAYIGTMELQKYPAFNEVKFTQLGKVVFRHGSTRIYKIE